VRVYEQDSCAPWFSTRLCLRVCMCVHTYTRVFVHTNEDVIYSLVTTVCWCAKRTKSPTRSARSCIMHDGMMVPLHSFTSLRSMCISYCYIHIFLSLFSGTVILLMRQCSWNACFHIVTHFVVDILTHTSTLCPG
jgi:hypothetical protein